jgi:hypothetical protein
MEKNGTNRSGNPSNPKREAFPKQETSYIPHSGNGLTPSPKKPTSLPAPSVPILQARLFGSELLT